MNPPPLYDYKGFVNVGMNSINHYVSKIDLTRFMDDLIFFVSFKTSMSICIRAMHQIEWIAYTTGGLSTKKGKHMDYQHEGKPTSFVWYY